MDSTTQELLAKADRLKNAERNHEAIEVCESILMEDLSCAAAFEEIGDNYIYLRDFPRAEKALRQAVKINPSSANAWYLMGFLCSCRRRFKESVTSLETADSLKPNHHEILRCLGWSFFHEGKKQKGIALLQRARQLEPEDTYILMDLGSCYLSMRSTVKAAEVFEEILSIDPAHTRARACLAMIENPIHPKKKSSKK